MGKPVQIRLGLVLAGLWLVLTTGIAASQTAPAASATSAALTDQLVQKLAQTYPESSIKRVVMDAALLNFVVKNRIDARLLENNTHLQGTSLNFEQPVERHALALVTLTYPTHAAALQQSERLVALQGYFRNTKILIRFRYRVVAETLVILFTENAADDALIAFINDFAESLKPTNETPQPVS